MRCSNFVYRTDYRRSGFDNRLFREAAFRLSKRKVSGVWNPKRRFRMARNAVYDRFDSRTVRTNFARQTNLLPDGTHIWLNAGSVLRDYGDLTGRRRVVELDGATVSTALRFTSEPASGEFSRWFIDDICVTK
jgi:fe2+-dicitrate sensor, membrane component